MQPALPLRARRHVGNVFVSLTTLVKQLLLCSTRVSREDFLFLHLTKDGLISQLVLLCVDEKRNEKKENIVIGVGGVFLNLKSEADQGSLLAE